MKKKVNILCDAHEMFDEELIEAILKNRGIKDIKHFLEPSEDDILPLDSLKNIDNAAKKVMNALKNKDKIMVHVDTDNDGVSSGVIMIKYLQSCSADVCWVINEQKAHGVTDKTIEFIKKEKPSLLIIVDSLDSNLDNYKMIREMGVDIIVLDHHIVDQNIGYGKFVTLVSSNVDYANPALSGAGVTWKFCKYLDVYYMGTFESDELIDMAMSGIVSDMVDLSEDSMENRAIVKLGISNIHNKSLKAMGRGFGFNSSTISFSVAPKVNACNRLNKNELAVNAMLENDDYQIKKYVKELNKVRDQQNEMVELYIGDAIEQMEVQKDKRVGIVILDETGGINGLLANQLMNQYLKPVLVLNESKLGYFGSARGIGVENFKEICERTDCCSCAGHELAFGIEIPYNCFDVFKTTIERLLKDVEFASEYVVDAELDPDAITDNLINRVKRVDLISGQGFPPLLFSSTIENFDVSSMSNGKHLVLKTPNCTYIQWNFKGDWEQLEEASMFELPVQCIGTLTSGFIGRQYHRQMILSDVIL